ncbi:PLP-dependent cysteine synthase family protein [Luteolibacter marinus]|uniref:PLP-dependent cysteine synthase family protein n=1 Tax=Luteolibacter marinus TaxID=2776705 RepID=UPI001868C07D|nr:cysteine synthase family protein [Luteolibacter marinus]
MSADVLQAIRSVPAGGRFIRQVPPTPLVPVTLDPALGAVWCKLEFMNPSGSTKDRIARHILEKAWRRGELRAGDTVVEASSGSTSIALALACAQMGLKFVAFIPASATNERGMMIRAYGGEVRRIDGGMAQVLEEAAAAAAANGWFAARQFENPDNSEAHRLFTGPEILAQMECGCVDAVVSGVGTGGTLRGLWEAFDAAGCEARAFAAIPCGGKVFGGNAECCSLAFSKEVPGVAECLSALYREWQQGPRGGAIEELNIGEDLCLDLTRQLWAQGFPVGPSSGLNYAAALEAKRRLGGDARVITVFPDRMERYFSHRVFAGLRDEA